MRARTCRFLRLQPTSARLAARMHMRVCAYARAYGRIHPDRRLMNDQAMVRRIAQPVITAATAAKELPPLSRRVTLLASLFFLLSARFSMRRDSVLLPFRAPSQSHVVTTGIDNPAELEHFDTTARPFDSRIANQEWFWFRVFVVMRYVASSMEKLLRLAKVRQTVRRDGSCAEV